MDPERLFSLAGLLVLPGWLLLAVAPRWRWTARLLGPVLIPLPLALLYTALLIVHWREGGFGSLADVAALFENEWLLLAGWVHYLAFDLFVGAWEVRDAQRLGIHHGLVVPCLLFTFLLGPFGLLLYGIVRAAAKRRISIGDQPA